MSRELISRSPDLQRLRDEGYEIDIVAGHLLVKSVPYVARDRSVKRGTLVSTLTLAGEKTQKPDTHVVFFIGEHPCHKDGTEIAQIVHQVKKQTLGPGLVVDRSFSNKPSLPRVPGQPNKQPAGYADYYEKMTTYAMVLSSHAQAIDPSATAKTYVAETTEAGSVFHYMDTASTRAEIGAVTARLSGHRVGIVGLGGTGSYILDLVAKTPVAEIHLFDDDRFLQHNAFRAPGAPSVDELRATPFKVDHLAGIYCKMHKGIQPHRIRVEPENADVLANMDFVFVCVDKAPSRRTVVDALREYDKPFIDVGMGATFVEDENILLGWTRVSSSVPGDRRGEQRVPTDGTDAEDIYDKNIQIADLNSLNAALAVIQWKKWCGFYQDLEKENWSTYTTNVSQLLTERLE